MEPADARDLVRVVGAAEPRGPVVAGAIRDSDDEARVLHLLCDLCEFRVFKVFECFSCGIAGY
jgi:hypothetical protein